MGGQLHAKATVFLVLIALAIIGPECVSPAAVARKAPKGAPALPKLWEKTLPSEIAETAEGLVIAGRVLIAYSGEMGTVWALDLASRRVLWTQQGQGHSEPDVLDDGDILLKHEDSIERINGRTGKRRWRYVFDGSFSDDGYIAIAGNLACLVYHDRPRGSASSKPDRLSGRQVIDLRTGRRLSPQPAYPANPLNNVYPLPGFPPRFLYQTPDLWALDVSGERPAAAAAYSLGCFNAVNGKSIWRTTLTSVLGYRWLEETDVWYPLGLFVLTTRIGAMETREFHWLDLSTGRVLGKDALGDRDSFVTPIVASLPGPERNLANATLANVLLISTSDSRFTLMKPGRLSKPLSSKDLSVYLSQETRLGHTWWEVVDADWPFALLRATTELRENVYTLLLMDVQSGAVYPVRAAKDWVTACLDKRGNMVVTVGGNRLSGYALPKQAEKHHR